MTEATAADLAPSLPGDAPSIPAAQPEGDKERMRVPPSRPVLPFPVARRRLSLSGQAGQAARRPLADVLAVTVADPAPAGRPA